MTQIASEHASTGSTGGGGAGVAAGDQTCRIGVVHPQDPAARDTWSGTPSGVIRGLEAAGAEVVAIYAMGPRVRRSLERVLTVGSLRPGRAPREALRHAREGVALAGARTAALQLRRGAFDGLDGVIQIGTGYGVPHVTPVATFEDMTLIQARDSPYALWQGLGRRTFDARVGIQRAVYGRAAACCATTRWAADSIVDDYGIPRAKVHAVGVGRNHVVDAPERDWSVPRFLFVGLEWERKNGPDVVTAFGRVRDEHPAAELHLVGNHPRIDVPGVTGHGFLPLDDPAARARVEDLLRAATCFVMPSKHEPSALAYVEAGAAGLPSVVSTAGGSPELVGRGGIPVRPGDVDALTSAMLALADPATACAHGARAHARSELFTWSLVAERLLRALRPRGVDVEALAPFI